MLNVLALIFLHVSALAAEVRGGEGSDLQLGWRLRLHSGVSCVCYDVDCYLHVCSGMRDSIVSGGT